MNTPTEPIALADLRVAAGLSQRKLAKAIGKTPSFVNLLESGARGASVATLGSIKAALALDDAQFAAMSAWFAGRASSRSEAPSS